MRAFPTDVYMDEQRIDQQPGMDLRDWFAGQIAASIALSQWQATESSYYTNDMIAQEAYLLADAMVRWRRKSRSKANAND
ncbi:hypothetical protein EBZ80_24595 [bacterium]|nr:hypothetical protein [bacterium]